MKQPLVSVIVVSYNHAPYVREAILSVVDQSYPNLEVIVVDDASEDDSALLINQLEAEGHSFRKILNAKNQGYCKAFNDGFKQSNGEFIIDLSADDVLLPNRVERGVSALVDSNYGVDFCDVYYIDESSKVLGSHFKRDSKNVLKERVPSGRIFKDLLKRYFICAPGMMMSRKVLSHLGGYDEELYYEDFDFWVRSSHRFDYHFTNEILVKKRVVSSSMSKDQYLPKCRMIPSTVKVCKKAYALCSTDDEFKALSKRVGYEMRQAILSNNLAEAKELYALLTSLESKSAVSAFWNLVLKNEWDLSFMSRFIRKAR